MQVLLQRSTSAGTVDELLAGLALREPSVDGCSLSEGILEDGDLTPEDVDVEALSDQDSQQLQEPLAALEALEALCQQLAESLEPFRASKHAPAAPVARRAHEVVSTYCKVVRLAKRLQGETATLELYTRLACPLLEAAELLLEAGELALLDSAMGIRANAGALHMIHLLVDSFDSHPLLEINNAMESLVCKLVTRGHALRSLVTLLVAAYPDGHDRDEGCTLVAAVYGMFCSLVAGDGEAVDELQAMGLRHVELKGCAEECYSSRISDEARLAALDDEYCSWLEQQATKGTVQLPSSAAEAATKLFALTGMLALLRCCEPLSALWSKHLEGTEQGAPVQGTRWNKMLLKLALAVYLRRVQRYHNSTRKPPHHHHHHSHHHHNHALPRPDLMPLAPTSYIRLEFKADRAASLYADASEAIEAAINAPDEPAAPASKPRATPAIDIPADSPETPCLTPGTGSYTAGTGTGSFVGTPRSGRTPRTPRTSAKAHVSHHHHAAGGPGLERISKGKPGHRKRR